MSANGQKPLVIIGVPCGDMMHSETARCLWCVGRATNNSRQGLAVTHTSIVANGRNNCVEAMQSLGGDYLMFIDSDMVFPQDTIDRLMAHGKDICGATYVRRGPPFDNLGQATPEYASHEKGLIKMFYIPTGMLLIKRKVFEALEAPYFRYGIAEEIKRVKGEDMDFCERAREAGFDIWCDLDLSMELRHIYTYMLSPIDPSTRAVAENFKKAEALSQMEAQGNG